LAVLYQNIDIFDAPCVPIVPCSFIRSPNGPF
jgi:hypothetical protein